MSLLAVGVVVGALLSGPTPAELSVVTARGALALSAKQQSDVTNRVRRLMRGCALNSLRPGPISADGLAELWAELRAEPHLHARFHEPFTTIRGGVMISEVVIGLGSESLIGPELSRHEGQFVAYGKCDGHHVLALMCAPALRPHLLPRQLSNCDVYDHMGDPRDEES